MSKPNEIHKKMLGCTYPHQGGRKHASNNPIVFPHFSAAMFANRIINLLATPNGIHRKKLACTYPRLGGRKHAGNKPIAFPHLSAAISSN